MNKPLIGVTQRRLATAQIAGVPSTILDTWMNAQLIGYARAVARAGGTPIHVSREADPNELAARLDGIVLAGGLDVDPRLYGKVPGPCSTVIDPDADRFETELVHAAFRFDTPLLGVCRGLHVINVALGGTLVDDLPTGAGSSHSFLLYPPHERVHRVTILPDSVIHGIYGDEVRVNSLHHQAVEEPGNAVRVVGRADDGICEAIEVAGRRVIGVQWHPEFFKEPDPLFEWLIKEAGATAQPAAFAEKRASR